MIGTAAFLPAAGQVVGILLGVVASGALDALNTAQNQTSIFNLNPLVGLATGQIDHPAIDSWIGQGNRLRMATVGVGFGPPAICD